MLTITGEVRKVLDDSYSSRNTGQPVKQAILVLEPAQRAQNYEIKLTSAQCKAGAQENFQKLIGQQVSMEVTLYVNYQYQFHRFTAVTGKPITKGR